MSEWKETDETSKTPITKRTTLNLSDTELLGDARVIMKGHITDAGGVYCPCCGAVNKVYARGIHWKSGVWLCQLVKRYLTEERWYQVQEFYDIRGGDYAKLRYWGLAELRPVTDYDKRTSGMWRPTEEGVKFAQGVLNLPAKVLLYQGKFIGFDEKAPKINIHQVLNGAEGPFSWSETMAAVPEVKQ